MLIQITAAQEQYNKREGGNNLLEKRKRLLHVHLGTARMALQVRMPNDRAGLVIQLRGVRSPTSMYVALGRPAHTFVPRWC